MSSNKSTLNILLPSIYFLKEEIEKIKLSTDNENVLKFRKQLFNFLDEYLEEILNNDKYILSTFLDPRFKDLNFILNNIKKSFLTKLKKKYENFNKNINKNQVNNNNNNNNNNNGIFKFMKTIKKNEIDCYFEDSISTNELNVFLYWKENQQKFKFLTTIAEEILCIPSTSTRCESGNSEMGDIITKKRNRISAETSQELIVLRDNSDLW